MRGAKLLSAALTKHRAGDLAGAEALYQQVLKADPRNADALHLSGVLALQSGRLDAGLGLLRQAVTHRPAFAEAQAALGNALMQSGSTEEAIDAWRTAAALQPEDARLRFNLGTALMGLGRLDESIACYRQAVAVRPDYVDAHSNLGTALMELGRIEEAATAFRQAIALAPDRADAHSNLGAVLRRQNRLVEAEDCCRRAVALDPRHPLAHANLGATLKDLGRLDESLDAYRHAVALQPRRAETHCHLGNALVEAGRLDEAVAAYGQAVALRPDYVEALSNLGNAVMAGGRLDEAIAIYRQSIALKPDYAEAHWNAAFALLLRGDLAEGWDEYEWRLQRTDAASKNRDFPRPRWDGDDLAGRTILLHGEQGLGDTIQFARYASALTRRGAGVILEAQPDLKRLLSHLPGVTVIGAGDPCPPFDVHCPLLSLPRAFRTTLATIPAEVPYLAAEPERVASWRSRLPGDGLRVGIAWQGNPSARVDRGRSPPLAAFAPLARTPGVHLVSLQKNDGVDQLTEAGVAVLTLGPDFDGGADAFLDTAAVMMSLDLVITSDTSVAHLAGALGRPVWVALKSVPDWRWLMEREDSPWYPTARLFRQAVAGDWSGVFERMAAEIGRMTTRPDEHAGALHRQGIEAFQSGRTDAAVDLIRQAVAIHPAYAEAHYNLGVILSATGKLEDAVAAYRASMAAQPTGKACSNLANALRELGRWDEALAAYTQAVALAPSSAEARSNLGNALKDVGRSEDALAAYRRAVELQPEYAYGHSNLGTELMELDRLDEAIAAFRRAVELLPDFAEGHYNLGNALMGNGDIEGAKAALRRAIALNPDHAEAHWNYAHALLLNGEFHHGWEEYEWRWRRADVAEEHFAAPRWAGEDPRGKTILLHAEQGLGDTLQFVRYAPVLAAFGAKVVVRAPRSLKRLLGTVAEATVVADGDPLPPFDLQCPLLGLPRMVEAIPAEVPYLAAEAERVEAWRRRLPTDGFRIGIVWQGDPRARIDRGRSPPLAAFAPLARVPGVRLVSLQKNHGLDQLAALPEGMTVTTLGPEFDAGPDAFIDTAAVMMSLDLVVASDTSVAHLAGALGRPVWVVVKSVPDWRWLMERSDSPWYPTLRLFRQTTAGDWNGVFARVAEALAHVVRPVPEMLAAALKQHRAGAFAEADALYRHILTVDPGHAGALHFKGVLASQTGRMDESIGLIRRSVAINPNVAEAHYNLGVVLMTVGRLDEAMAAFRHTIAVKPAYADAHFNLGTVLMGQGRADEAIAAYHRAIAVKPGHALALSNLGVALKSQGRLVEAVAAYRQAVAADGTYAETHGNLGHALLALGTLDEAAECYRRAIALRPGNAGAHVDLGGTLLDLGHPDEAIAEFRQAIALRPTHAVAHCNLGSALMAKGLVDEGARSFRHAIDLDPDNADAHWNSALVLLLQGDFARGWDEYEWRWRTTAGGPKRRDFPQPLWTGERLDGRTILLHAEQGLGDTIQFVRYCPAVVGRGGTVVLEVPSSLRRLLGHIPGVTVIGDGDPLPRFDVHCPLLGLPRAFGTGLDTIPAEIPYLAAEPERVAPWRERLPRDGFRVGIAWQGNPSAKADRGRSPPLAAFAPLAAIPGVRLVSLQKNDGLDQLAAVPTVMALGPGFDAGPDAFIDTAAVMTGLDLIITPDTSIAHLAGALGRPTWVVLKAVPDWRWLMGREDSPWYPTTRLFRQTAPGDWGGVFERVAEALAATARPCTGT